MTDFSVSDVSSDISTQEEDAPIVSWIDQTISEAEQSGFLSELALHVTNDSFSDPNQFAASVDQARDESTSASEESVPVPSVPPTLAEIREAIFAKIRRPDGTPFAAGYVAGPAARKPIYEGEDVRNGVWRSGEAGANLDTRVTRYEDRSTIGERAAQQDEGLVVDAQGDPIDGAYGWVIDQQSGALLLFDPSDNQFFAPDGSEYFKPSYVDMFDLLRQGYRVRGIHHTTPVAGMPVTGAGMMELSFGQITKITDESGHYRPDGAQQYDAVSSLQAQNYDLDEAKIRMTGNVTTGRPTDKAGWINAAAATNPDFPTGDVDLQANQFLQTGGDEYQIRMKQALNQEINARGDQPGTQYSESPDPVPSAFVPGDDSSSSDDDDSSFSGGGVIDSPDEVVIEGEIFEINGARRLRVTFDNNNYRDYAEGDEDAPAVPDDAQVVDRTYARTSTSDWKRTTRFVSGRVAVDIVSTWQVPDAIKANTPAFTGDDSISEDDPASISQHDPSASATSRDRSASASGASESGEGDSAGEGSIDDDGDDAKQGTTSTEDSEADSNADSVAQARAYLQSAGHAAFATWLGSLPEYAQDLLLADPELAAAWRRENAAPQPPAWQPAEADWAAAANTNAAVVDSLDDRGTANYTVAGLSLIIGGGHDAQHTAWASSAADRSAGSVTVRKSGIGRGAGSLTFTGVPPAKQEIVRASVARFSRKEVRFG
jgi:hypothetical protein